MRVGYLVSTLLLVGLATAVQGQSPSSGIPSSGSTAKAPASAVSSNDSTTDRELLRIKRIYVDSFGDDPQSKQIQAMVVASLAESKRFVVTESKERADAVLKGSGEEKTSQEFHSHSESTAAGGFAGAAHSSPGYSSAGIAGRAASIQDSGSSTETIDRANIAVRLVNRDGDVIWSTKQNSHGAKYKGATADVADKIVKQLTWAVERAEKTNSATPTAVRP